MALSPAAAKILGQKDSRGLQGILSRGTNVYKAGSNAAHSGGGPQYGRPKKNVQPVGNNPKQQAMMNAARRRIEAMKRGSNGR